MTSATDPPDAASMLRDGVFGEMAALKARARLCVSVLGESYEPVRVGKYVLHGRVGAGAMGVVYGGYDETLDRRVAIKLIHAHEGGGDDAYARMLREAKALASLDHPNVVKVFDAGIHRAQMYIAMEFVAGQTLSRWLSESAPKSWRDVLRVYMEAGTGLAEAHKRGLVHRDFKPDNAMLGHDGRVRVMDFGLVRGMEEAPSEPESGTTEGGSGSVEASEDALALPLTSTGALVGTPAYMSPEQLRGQVPDARADQFSFCVALWEALDGKRPFAGATPRALLDTLTQGAAVVPSSTNSVPTWVRRVLTRGLAMEAEDRWPSMQALLAALGRDPSRRRRQVAVAACMVGAMVSLAAWNRIERQAALDTCEREGAAVDADWGPDVAQQMREAFLKADPEIGASTSQRVGDLLDAFAHQWRQTRTEVCLEATVERTRSASSQAMSVACLAERRLALTGLVSGLAEPTPRSMRGAVLSAGGLPAIDVCTDDAWLAHRAPPPDDSADREKLLDLRRQLAKATALQALGRYDEATDRATPLLAPAEALDYAPLVAEVLLRIGSLASVQGRHADAERDLERALLIASRHGHDRVTMDAFAVLVWVVGYHLDRHDEGLRLGRMAEMTLARFGQAQSPRAATLLAYVASIQEEAGDLDGALQSYERALSIAEATLGKEHSRVAAALSDLGGIHDSRGDYVRAVEFLERGLLLREQTVGPRHPSVGQSLHALARVYTNLENYDEAETRYLRALALFTEAFGLDHPHIPRILDNLGRMEASRGRLDKSAEYIQRALDRKLSLHGPDHPTVAMSRNSLGHTFVQQRRWAEAVEQFKESWRVNEAVYGGEHPEVAISLGSLGTAYRRMERLDDAVVALERALTIQRTALGEDHINVSITDAYLGEAYGELGRWDDALALYQHAMATRLAVLGDKHAYFVESQLLVATGLIETGKAAAAAEMLGPVLAAAPNLQGMPNLVPAASFELARALWETGGDRARATSLAQTARTAFSQLQPANDRATAEVDAWIAAHPSEHPVDEKKSSVQE